MTKKNEFDGKTEMEVIVNGLWIGTKLSLIETLTITSFLKQGHKFRLFVYEPIQTPLPQGCITEDANKILPESSVFRYKNTTQFGQGKGSVSGFSDIFRYKLLYDEGGWWSDMDITCLKPLTVEGDYYFRDHPSLPLVGNMMKAPKGCDLMRLCFEKASSDVDEHNRDWHKPIEILAQEVEKLGLTRFIDKGYEKSNPDDWDEVKNLLLSKADMPQSFYFVHWMNENWRSKGLDKNDFMIGSAYFKLLVQFGLIEDDFNVLQRWKNRFRHRYLNWY